MTIHTDQIVPLLGDRRQPGVRRTDDMAWPEARLLAEALRLREDQDQ